MLTATLKSLVSRFNLENQKVGEVAAGAVIKHSRDWNLARESMLGSGLHPETPAYDVQRACGTSLDGGDAGRPPDRARARSSAASPAACDTRQRHPPIATGPSCADRCSSQRARGRPRENASVASACGQRHLKPSMPGVTEPRTGLSMGAALRANGEGMADPPRRAGQLAAREPPQRRGGVEGRLLEDLVVPFNGLKRDNNVRADTSLEKLATLQARVRPSSAGTLTAGNSTPLTDGAAVRAARLARSGPRARGLPVLAYPDVFGKRAAVDFVGRQGRRHADGAGLRRAAHARTRRPHAAGLRLLRDPRSVRRAGAVHAEGVGVPRVLSRRSAARARSAPSIARRSTSRARSIAIGHPFAATGARIVATLAKLLVERGTRARADLHLHRRRDGRHRDPRALEQVLEHEAHEPRARARLRPDTVRM